MKRLIACLALLLGLSGAIYAQDAAPASNGLLIRINIYSGRPDPEFRITDPGQIAKINELLNGCASLEASFADTPVITDKLGYRGIEVFKLDDASASLGSIYAFAVNKDNVLVHSKKADSKGIMAAQKLARKDASAALERYLLELALGYGQLGTKVVDRILHH